MNTYAVKAREIKQKWVVLDASGKILGRLASQIAAILRGKDKAIFSPHLDTGDYVIVINAAHIRISGNKEKQKFYYRHSMYPGGLRSVQLSEVMAKEPEKALKNAVKGMLPHGPLGNKLITKLKVYPEGTHPHQAQVNAPEKASQVSQAPEAKSAEPEVATAEPTPTTAHARPRTTDEGKATPAATSTPRRRRAPTKKE